MSRGGQRSALGPSGAKVISTAGAILGRTLTGAEEVGREVGVTAMAAMRGSVVAAGRIGGELFEVTKAAVEGTRDAAERIGTAATRAVQHIASADGETRRSASRPMTRRRLRRRRRMAKVKTSPKSAEATA